MSAKKRKPGRQRPRSGIIIFALIVSGVAFAALG
jgi:hypothetical protein